MVVGLSRILRRAARPTVNMPKLLSLLEQRGVSATRWTPVTGGAHLAAHQEALFAPLFASSFVFENHQLTLLGDTIIDEYLSGAIASYCLDSGVIASTSTIKQLLSIFHNHFSLRYFAEQLQFSELCHPTAASGAPGDHSAPLFLREDELTAPDYGPRRADVVGTSFDFAPLPCGQSALGWKFSHFIGALHQVYGDSAAKHVLHVLYDLDGASNIGGHAARLLHRLVDRYSPTNVAEALLAAQGIPVEFFAKSIFNVTGDDRKIDAESASTSGTSANEQTSTGSAPEALRLLDDAPQQSSITITGFGDSTPRSVQQALNASARESLVAGPGYVDTVGTWLRRETAGGTATALQTVVSEGWLTPEEHSNEKRGPAFSGFVDFENHVSFADAVGFPHPAGGVRAYRKSYKHPVRDKQFFDKMSDFRSGIPVNTQGLPVPEFLKKINSKHERVFEVSLIVRGATVLGRAVSKRYTEARRGACQGYLVAVARDLERLTTSSTNSNDS